MYKQFFGLQTNPFTSSPDPRFLYMMPHTQEALACLEYGISARKGFTVLTGEVGTGKTTLLRCALSSLKGQRGSSAFVFNPRVSVLGFFEFVLADFGIVPLTYTKSGMLLQLNNWLVERFAANETCVVVIDEAQHLSWELLEEVRLLTNLETSSQKLLQIVLSGQPELEEKLHHPSVRQLRQRVCLWCRTQPLTAEQTRAYVAERLRLSGRASRLFLAESLDLVHRYSRGIPRVINLLCEHALLAAYVEQIQQISAGMVELVARELELVPQNAAGDRTPPRIQTNANGPIHSMVVSGGSTVVSGGDHTQRTMASLPSGSVSSKLPGPRHTRHFSSLRNRLANAPSRLFCDESEQAPALAGRESLVSPFEETLRRRKE